MTAGILGDLLDLLFPAICLHCRAARAVPGGLCAACGEALEGAPGTECLACRAERSGVGAPHADHGRVRLLASCIYAGPLVDLVHALKYGAREDLALGLGEAMGRRLLGLAAAGEASPALLLPVPLHASRERERGYNQSLLLARATSRTSGVPVPASNPLRRVRSTRAQAELAPGRRGENVRGAFAADASPLVAGKHLVLVDDVVTTGATALDAARALFDAGADRVLVLAAGRTPLPGA